MSERDQRAGAGEKRQREGDSAAHTEVGAGGAGGRRRLAEEVGGVGPHAGSCCSPSGRLLAARDPQGANKAAGAPGAAPPAAAPTSRGARARAPAPEAAGAGERKSGEDRAGGRPQAGSGHATARGLVWPPARPTAPDRVLPPRWMRGGGSPGEPRSRLADRRGVNYRKREGPRTGPGL